MKRRLLRGVGFVLSMVMLIGLVALPLWLPSVMLAILEVLE